VQDIQISTRASRAQYQYTLVATDAAEVAKWSDELVDALRQNPTFRDVSSEAQEGGLRVYIDVDREKAGRLGINMQVVNDTLNDAFGQRQISTIYGQANQYRVILEAAPQYQKDPSALAKLYVPANIPSQPLQSSSAQNIQPLSSFVPGASNTQVPLSAFARMVRTTAPLAIAHQEQFPSVTLSFNLAAGAALGDAVGIIASAERVIGMPTSVIGSYSGGARRSRRPRCCASARS
jgi:multidrug efflux pump